MKKHIEEVINKYDQVKCDQMYKKHKHELVNESKKQPDRRFLHSDLALKIIMSCITDELCNLKKNYGLNCMMWLILKNKQY